ncbi:MAG: nucleotidyl transferase AbiEii/AbiGii toxin family protein [Bacilli bacterium]
MSTGDVITPFPVQYELGRIFDDNVCIKLWGYNIETIMAEKMKTILIRGIFNTRPRDYYDIYILCTTQKYDKKLFREALEATAMHRGSSEKIADTKAIIALISDSEELQVIRIKYQKKFAYAQNIAYGQIIKVLEALMQV